MSQVSILCPVDYSEGAAQALAFGAALSEHFGARLIVLHAVDPLLAGAAAVHQLDVTGPEARADLVTFCSGVFAEWPRAADLVDYRLTVGPAADEILGLAEKSEADLIVMGTHGLTGYRKLFFGSVTHRVLRRTHIPVLAVPSAEATGYPVHPRLLTGGTVLAPVDFSPAADRATRVAAGIATGLGLPLTLMHVVTPTRVLSRWREPAAEQDRRRVAGATADLEALARRLGLGGVEPIVAVGSPAEEIARAATQHRAAVIVLGLHGAGSTMLSHAPGSVTYAVLCHGLTPVLAVPRQASLETRLRSQATSAAVSDASTARER